MGAPGAASDPLPRSSRAALVRRGCALRSRSKRGNRIARGALTPARTARIPGSHLHPRRAPAGAIAALTRFETMPSSPLGQAWTEHRLARHHHGVCGRACSLGRRGRHRCRRPEGGGIGGPQDGLRPVLSPSRASVLSSLLSPFLHAGTSDGRGADTTVEAPVRIVGGGIVIGAPLLETKACWVSYRPQVDLRWYRLRASPRQHRPAGGDISRNIA
jgi:hypothetical protein